MKFSNEVKIGLVVLAATVIAFLGFRFMKDEPLLSRVKLLYTTYDDVGGLSRGSTVYVNGLKVGSVRELNYKFEVDSIEVVMSITEPIPIPKGSKALLAPPGIIGSPVIEIERSNNSTILEWGSRLEGVKEPQLMDSFSGLADSGPAVVDSVQQTLGLVNNLLRSMNGIEKNVSSDIEKSVSNFQKTSATISDLLEQKKAEIDSLISATENTMSNISDLSDSSTADVESLIANLEKFSSELDVLSQNLQESTESMNSILRKMDAGEGTMGLMINDPSLYNNLDSLTFNLNDLILKIQEDPGKYLKHMRLVDLF